MTSYRTLLVEERADRMVVRLNRATARNAVDSVMVTDLHAVCDRLEDDPLPLLLFGGDGYFGAGADITELIDRRREDALIGKTGALFERIHRLPMPTVAAVDGYAFGGGAELAYACDIRVASPRAVFGNPEPGLGIIAAAGACSRLRELVGEPLAKLVLLTGHRVDATQALRVGLVAEVVEPGDLETAAHRLVDRMVEMSQMALRLTKLVTDAREVHPLGERLAQALMFEDAERQTRMGAFLHRHTRKEPTGWRTFAIASLWLAGAEWEQVSHRSAWPRAPL